MHSIFRIRGTACALSERCSIAAALLVATAGMALAEGPASADQPANHLPRLGDHVFVSSSQQSEPFITTHIENTTGVGRAVNLVNTILEIDGEPILESEGSLSYGTVQFEYQHAVREWLAVWGGVDAFARIGNGTATLLSQGINAAVGFELGWLFRMFETDASLLSGSLQLWNNDLTTINVRDFIEEDLPLARNSNSVRTGGSLRWAYGISPLWGVMVSGTAGWGESLDTKGENGWFGSLDGGVSLNLHEAKGVPLGFGLGGLLTSFPDTGDDLSGNLIEGFLRVAHTGREDLRVGLDLTIQRIPKTRLPRDVYVSTFGLNLRYYY